MYVYMNVHSQLGMPCTKTQQLRLWILESKCIMKLQYLCLKHIVINYKLSLMSNAPLWAQWVDQNEVLISFGFLLLRPQDGSFGVVGLCCKVPFCFSICSWTGVCLCFFYGTSIAVSPLYIACLFAASLCFLQQLRSFFSCLLCQTHIYM